MRSISVNECGSWALQRQSPSSSPTRNSRDADSPCGAGFRNMGTQPLKHFAAMGLAIGWTLGLPALANAQTADGGAATRKITAPAANPHSVGTAPSEPVTDPVADPRAVVTLGRARFTVLTPELIRMEWAADGKFEDHASFVFLNRRLPVPPFEHEVTEAGQKLTIKTSALALTYTARADGRFGPDNLAIQLAVSGKRVDWHPGVVDAEN